MRKLVAALVLSLPALAFAKTFTNAPLVDHNCEEKVKADPDAHPTSCLLSCASSGYGILENGKWIKFDKEGNEKAVAALKATHRKDHVRADVTGEMKGSVLHVTSLTIPE